MRPKQGSTHRSLDPLSSLRELPADKAFLRAAEKRDADVPKEAASEQLLRMFSVNTFNGKENGHYYIIRGLGTT